VFIDTSKKVPVRK